MRWFLEKDSTLDEMTKALAALEKGYPATLAQIARVGGDELASMDMDQRRSFLIARVKAAIDFARAESNSAGHAYHSRDPLVGLMQSWLGSPDATKGSGELDPLVWAPAGVGAILEHFERKAPFKTATERSRIALPAACKVALLSDWGADNEHAKRLGDLAVVRGADYVIHLGDIYYSGTASECASFIERWQLREEGDRPRRGKSFALNGNHEMYSLGRYYFSTVLDGLGQEASYFTLVNEWWQIHGLDTAYVPFSISGGDKDANLRVQWDWLVEGIRAHPEKRNIVLSHHQPVSAHLPDLEASRALESEWEKLTAETSTDAVFAWFFGHEHRCAIYDDTKTFFKARLIGNGSIPHLPQTELSAQVAQNGASATGVWRINHGKIGPEVAISTFAMLSFSEDRCVAEYINEDGSLFYAEELNGGANCELVESGAARE